MRERNKRKRQRERESEGEVGVREELSLTLMMTLAMGVDNVCQRGRDTRDRQRRQFDMMSSDERRQGQAKRGLDRHRSGQEQAVQGEGEGGGEGQKL